MKPTRRQFGKVLAAAAGCCFIPHTAFGANESVNIAVIGLGLRGSHIANTVKGVAGAKLVAVCDIVQPRIADFVNRQKGAITAEQGFTDFRKMIETVKPDGVCVQSATHQRAWITAHAMLLGCHTYIEKPMALTITEGRYLVNLARKTKRITQVGTQQRSMPLPVWACQQIAAGAIGKVKLVEAPNFVGPTVWIDKPGEPYSDGFDEQVWDIWQNQAPVRPFRKEIVGQDTRWGLWRDYDGGGLSFGVTGWGAHSYDQINAAIGANNTGPAEIVLEEPVSIQTIQRFNNYTGPRAKVTMRFADGIEVRMHQEPDRGPGLGCVVTGEKGKFEINRAKIVSNPLSIVENKPKEVQNWGADAACHLLNWVECIKSGKLANADIEIGQRGHTLCELVNIVRATAEVGKVIGWDSVKERFTNNDKGNEMLSRPRRKGYELPNG
ncbi:MAG: Gfo/Idh/MocA family oxidoreductase, partial [Planctomycetaceae bacterium]|jgi:predicted dehydrogenase|nr:Gfo/Idh/MocA family oxidoreductase [Planctomycetaceae bacterium]